MKIRRFLTFLLVIAMVCAAPVSAAGDTAKVYLDGKEIRFSSPVMLVKGTTYVPVREFCRAISPECSIEWTAPTQTATISADNLTMYISIGSAYIYVNGRYFYTEYGSFLEGGVLMAPLRQLAKAFDAECYWDPLFRGAAVTSGRGYATPGDRFYDADEVYWLSRIIYAESGAEPFKGQIAVGNVVLNRVRSDDFPDTIYDVVFDRAYGVQFTPTANGMIYKNPSRLSIIAAKIALEGYQVVPGSLYFLNPAISTSNWIIRNREFIGAIGNHSFYY